MMRVPVAADELWVWRDEKWVLVWQVLDGRSVWVKGVKRELRDVLESL